MGETGIAEAEQIGRVWGSGGAMDSPGLPPRVVWHTTESGAGDAAFSSIGAYLLNQDVYPHILFDPTTDRLGQYLPLSMSARALKNDGSTRTNRTGAVCIQIEVLARAANPFTTYWRPGPNFRALMRAIRSWHIPDSFPMGTPAATSAQCRRIESIWLHEAGHYGHCNVPGNDHWDPGAISPTALFAAAKAPAQAPPASPTTMEDPVPTELISAGNADLTHASGAVVRLPFADDKQAIVTGPCHYDVDVNLYLTGVPAGGQVQGRFLHVKGTTVNSGPIVEAVGTDGQTFAQFSKKGTLAAGESLQFQVQAMPADSTGAAFSYRTTYRLAQGLVWKA